jgi:hypothetical protein
MTGASKGAWAVEATTGMNQITVPTDVRVPLPSETEVSTTAFHRCLERDRLGRRTRAFGRVLAGLVAEWLRINDVERDLPSPSDLSRWFLALRLGYAGQARYE